MIGPPLLQYPPTGSPHQTQQSTRLRHGSDGSSMAKTLQWSVFRQDTRKFAGPIHQQPETHSTTNSSCTYEQNIVQGVHWEL